MKSKETLILKKKKKIENAILLKEVLFRMFKYLITVCVKLRPTSLPWLPIGTRRDVRDVVLSAVSSDSPRFVCFDNAERTNVVPAELVVVWFICGKNDKEMLLPLV